MKRAIAVLGLALLAIAWQGYEHIRWTWQGETVWSNYRDGETLQLGLRNDGVVVWRTLRQTINSPAEQGYHPWLYGVPPVWLTNNLWLTNAINLDAISK